LFLLLVRLVFDVPMLLVLALGAASAMAQLFFPAQQAGLVRDFPARRATALAWNNGALFLGISLGSLIGGQAISAGGFAANAVVSAVFAAIGWVLNQTIVPNPVRPRIKAVTPTR
jgi:predicted MFS family arabinose efflux permease